MREDDSRRTLKWLTEGIDRLLARERMEWARQLQKKSLTSGAIDADSAAGHSGKGTGGGKKGKGKAKARVKAGRGKRDQSRDSSGSNKQKGICHMYVRHGQCSNDDCRIPTYPKIKSSLHLGKAARISGIRPARATMRTRVHADVARGKDKEGVSAYGKEGKTGGARQGGGGHANAHPARSPTRSHAHTTLLQ